MLAFVEVLRYMANEPKKSATRLTKKAKPSGETPAPVVPAKAVEREEMPESTTQVVDLVRSTQGERVMVEKSETPILNGVKAAGEVLVFPGSSLILDGNVKSGATHMVGACLARVLLGPVGWAYVAADSWSVSVSGKNLYEHFIK